MGYVGDKKREYDRQWKSARRQEWINENGPCSCGSFDRLEVEELKN